MEVAAVPGSEERRILRRELPSVVPFQRLYDIFAVGDVFLGIDTLDTRLFNFYHE